MFKLIAQVCDGKVVREVIIDSYRFFDAEFRKNSKKIPAPTNFPQFSVFSSILIKIRVIPRHSTTPWHPRTPISLKLGVNPFLTVITYNLKFFRCISNGFFSTDLWNFKKLSEFAFLRFLKLDACFYEKNCFSTTTQTIPMKFFL